MALAVPVALLNLTETYRRRRSGAERDLFSEDAKRDF
jgi:hypothetical protein